MKLYPLFVVMAATTVLSPGPGIVMTLSNSLRYGVSGALGGILGIAIGAVVVAGLSATSLGIMLTMSASAFLAMKLLGAAYLIYLGVKLWRAPAFQFTARDTGKAAFTRRFGEGLSLQLTNPKAIFFFLSVFPQFIDEHGSYAFQFSVLVLTYSALVVLIHSLYGAFAHRARTWLTSERGSRTVNRAGAAMFVFFGIVLAGAPR